MQFHGECKTSGGKLIAVDVTMSEKIISSIQITGDFFIHPEPRAREVLDSLTSAILGKPSEIETNDLISLLEARLPWECELIGTSIKALAIAVKRACGEPHVMLEDKDSAEMLSQDQIENSLARWKKIRWKLIPELSLSPAMNVSLDEVLSQEVAQERRSATLRFWKWASPAVIIGRCQSVMNEVDSDEARKKNISIVRRMTGGGAMFLQPHGAITYSLYLPESLLEGMSLKQSYQLCDHWVTRKLNHLGVDAFHAPLNDITCSMGKIGGAAQARRAGVVLHHTTLAYDMDPGEMVSVLRIGKEKYADKPGVASAAKRVSPLVRQTGLSREAIVQELMIDFHSQFAGELDSITSIESALASDLVLTKYGQDHWTYDLP